MTGAPGPRSEPTPPPAPHHLSCPRSCTSSQEGPDIGRDGEGATGALLGQGQGSGWKDPWAENPLMGGQELLPEAPVSTLCPMTPSAGGASCLR